MFIVGLGEEGNATVCASLASIVGTVCASRKRRIALATGVRPNFISSELR
jgi:hypothetical protein